MTISSRPLGSDTAIDNRWLSFSPHNRKSPDPEIKRLVARYGKWAVQQSLEACERIERSSIDDDWWLIEATREIGRQHGSPAALLKEKHVRDFIRRSFPEHALANDRRLRRRFNDDPYLFIKLALLAIFVEAWPGLSVPERRTAVANASRLALALDDSAAVYFEAANGWPDSQFESQPLLTGLMNNGPQGAQHYGATALIRDWLGGLVFP